MKLYIKCTETISQITSQNLKNIIKLFQECEGCKVSCNDNYIKFTWEDDSYLTEYYSIDELLEGLCDSGLSYEDLLNSPRKLLYNNSKVNPITRCSAKYSSEVQDYKGDIRFYDEEYQFRKPKPAPEISPEVTIVYQDNVSELSDIVSMVEYANSILTKSHACATITAFMRYTYQPAIVIRGPSYMRNGRSRGYSQYNQILIDTYPKLEKFAKSLSSLDNADLRSTNDPVYIFFDFKL